MMVKNEDKNIPLYLFIIIKKYIRVLYNYKIKVCLLALPILIIGVYITPTKKYISETTLFFNVSKQSRFLSLVNSFSGNGFQDISFYKFKNVALSDSILDEVLLTKIQLDSTENHIINYLIKYDIWKKNEELQSIDFTEHSFYIDSIKSQVFTFLKRSIELNEDKDELIHLSFKSSKEALSKHFNDLHYQAIDNFFCNIQLNQDMKSLSVLGNKRDSVQQEIIQTEEKLAELEDFSHNTVKQKAKVDIKSYQRKLRVLNEMYIELVKQYELVNYRVLDHKNLIVKLDSPRLPLEKVGRSKLKSAVIFGIIGFFLSSFLVLSFHYIKELNEMSKTA